MNFSLSYKLDSVNRVDFSTGIQDSYAQTVFLDKTMSPMSTRTSTTHYMDFKADLMGFSLHLDYLSGNQDVLQGEPGFQYDLEVVNSTVEYSKDVKNITFRSELGMHLAQYDDSNYAANDSLGSYLNGLKQIYVYSGSLRADYTFVSFP